MSKRTKSRHVWDVLPVGAGGEELFPFRTVSEIRDTLTSMERARQEALKLFDWYDGVEGHRRDHGPLRAVKLYHSVSGNRRYVGKFVDSEDGTDLEFVTEM
jgi:hypothetical protein